MTSNRIPGLFLRSQIVQFNVIRYLRGGVTIQLREEKRKTRLSKEQKEARLKQMIRSNPGSGEMLHLIKERTENLDPDLDPDYVEELATGSVDYREKYKEFYGNAEWQFDRKSLCNIKRKYFKEPKLPNMVSYIEKQDMKSLHEEDPENWDIEKLAECFPVTPAIAKKILRSPFRAYTVEQVKKHDKSVQRNWELFKKGKLEISDELKAHYSKFVDRISFETRDHVIKKYLPPAPNFEVHLPRKEFGSIIESYENLKNGGKRDKIQIDEDDKIILEDPNINVKAIPETNLGTRGKIVTLDELRKRIKKNPKMATEASKLIVQMEKKYVKAPQQEPNPVEAIEYQAEDAKLVSKQYEYSLPKQEESFPLRIRIPKDKWKRDRLYQIKDRFYDDTGYFMFRVPGLFN